MVEVPTSVPNASHYKKSYRGKMEKLGLYLHIPFCLRKCSYCDFYSIPFDEQLKDRYLKALEKEIIIFSTQLHDWQSDSLYLGGGTPSLLITREVERIISLCQKHFSLSHEAEITLEANPDTLDLVKLKGYRSAGINRLSLGFQSFNDKELKLIGRLHSVKKAQQTFNQARKAGIENINLDLMIGLPTQNLERWKYSVKEAIRLKPQHISTYILEIKGTSIWGKVPPAELPSEKLIEDMYYLAIDYLTSQGYKQYEISNFSLPGFSSYHNLKYWNDSPYLGLGPSAHSYYGNFRYGNTPDVSEYIELIASWDSARESRFELTLKKRIEEALFLGLRKTEGIKLKVFKEKYGVDIIDKFSKEISHLREAGLIENTDEYLKLTRKGLLLSNEAFQVFLLD